MAQTSVKIMLLGSNQALRDIQGLRKETNATAAAEKKALAEVTRAAKQAEQEKIRGAQRAAAAEKKAAEQATRAATKEAEKQRREADRLAEHWAKLAQKSADARMRAEERVTKQAALEAEKQRRLAERTQKTREKDAREGWRRAGGAISAGVSGVMAGGIAATATARGITGVDDVATRVQKANEFRQKMIVTAANAGLNERETSALQEKVTTVAKKYAVDPSIILEGLQDAHDRFNALQVVAKDLDALVKAGKATDTDFRDIVGTLGSARESYGIDDLEAAANLLIATGKEGAINFKAFSGVMAPQMGVHAINTQQTGMEGLRQFIAVMQTVGAGQFGAEGSAVRGSQAMSYLNRQEVVDALEGNRAKGIKGIGVKVRDAEGKIDMGSVIEQLESNPKFQTATQQAAIFSDAQAREGIQTLINQRRKADAGLKTVSFESMSAVDASAGADITNEVMRRLEGSGLMEMQRQAIEMQNDTIANLKDYNTQILAVTKASNKLEKALGTLSLWASAIGTAGVAGAGGSLAWKLLGGGGGAAAGAAGGAGAAAAGAGGAGVMAAMAAAGNASLGTLAAAGAAGIGTIIAGVGAALASGAAIGYGLDKTTEAVTGKGLSDRYSEYLMEQLGNWEGVAQAKLEPIEGAIDVAVTVKDDRVDVSTQVGKSKGARIISTQAGPNMASAL